jgi:hypothetical protein
MLLAGVLPHLLSVSQQGALPPQIIIINVVNNYDKN